MLPGDPRGGEVMRVNVTDLNEGRLNANILLQDSDTIVVPAADRFYVTGYVRDTGFVRAAAGHERATGDRGSRRLHRTRLAARHQDPPQGQDEKDVEIDAKLTDPVSPNDTIVVRQRLI